MVSFLISFLLPASLCSSAYAWKLKTHAYIANIAMDDAKDGKVWIPPFGEFEVRPEVVEAINQYPEFFRGGSIGPDGFPDMWTGQAYIHPDTDPWLRHLWNFLSTYKLPTANRSSTDRTKAVAFTFGYFSHCAGDMWAHDWVNVYAGKAFPAVAEMKADPANNVPVAVRHIAIENTLDKRVPLGAKTIDIPNDFLASAMVLNRKAQACGMNPVINYYVNKYFEKESHKDETVKVAGVSTGVKTWDANWYDDLVNGFKSTDAQNPGWIEANKRALKDVMEKDKGMIGALGDNIGPWAVTYLLDMAGWPSITRAVGENLTWNKAMTEKALDAIGLSEDVRSNLKDNFVNALLIITLGMDKATFGMIWTAEMTSNLFSADKTAEIMADIGMPPSEATWANAWNNQTNFNYLIAYINGPVYNSVITTKLCMLTPSELKRLLGEQLPDPTGQVVIIGAIKGIDFSRQFTKPEGLMVDWLGYGMSKTELQNASWRPIFPFVFKPYGPRDAGKQEVWSASLDASHRWAALYPVSLQILIKPPVLSNILMSQFNSETIEVVFKSDKEILAAALEYQAPGSQTKATLWASGASLLPGQGLTYTLSVHEAGMPAGIYKVRIKVKDKSGNEIQTGFTDFALFGASADWGFTATPGANNTCVLSWNKYPRSGEFQKYVLDKGDQVASTQSMTAHATSYDAAQMPQQGFQPIEITNINTAARTIPASLLTDLTLSARSKRGNFLTKPIAPTMVQAQTTTTTSSTTTPAGTSARQRYQ